MRRRSSSPATLASTERRRDDARYQTSMKSLPPSVGAIRNAADNDAAVGNDRYYRQANSESSFNGPLLSPSVVIGTPIRFSMETYRLLIAVVFCNCR